MKTLNKMIEMHKRLSESSDQHEDKRGAFYSAEEHRRLAECLEELDAYRTQHAALCEKFGVNTIEDLYGKAVDDFSDKIISLSDDGEFMNKLNKFPATTILEFATLLKEGKE